MTLCIERGKPDRDSPFPPDMKGLEGASEITRKLIESGASADKIMKKALIVGMNNLGERFGRGEAFIPELLIAAKAMYAAMEHLKPFFESGEAERKGTVIVGTVYGDLHDIGKNIVRMVLEGDGWRVIDLGANVPVDSFMKSLDENPGANIGMSALLTTTMANMETSVKKIKNADPGIRVFIGGAPITHGFSDSIGADGYFPDPHSFTKYLSGAG